MIHFPNVHSAPRYTPFWSFSQESLLIYPFFCSDARLLDFLHTNHFQKVQSPAIPPAFPDLFLMIHFLNVHSAPRYALFWSFSQESLLIYPFFCSDACISGSFPYDSLPKDPNINVKIRTSSHSTLFGYFRKKSVI